MQLDSSMVIVSLLQIVHTHMYTKHYKVLSS
jgi:hypothetical protein